MCGANMRLVGRTPDPGRGPSWELRTFMCFKCKRERVLPTELAELLGHHNSAAAATVRIAIASERYHHPKRSARFASRTRSAGCRPRHGIGRNLRVFQKASIGVYRHSIFE